MKFNRINAERVVSIIGTIYMGLALMSAILLNGDSNSIIPHSKIVIIVTHSVCALLSFISIFKTGIRLKIVVLLTESCLLILTNYEILGIFFFYFAIILLVCNNFFTSKSFFQASILFDFHLLNILLMYTHGWPQTIVALATSVFAAFFFYWIYKILKSKLSYLLPSSVTNNEVLQSVKPGSEISLKDYNLTDRQIDFVLDYLHNNLSYNDLSEKYYVSLSTVKKDFAEVFKIFNVTKLEELHILFLQYHIVK